jgi:hypothetical protein
LNFSRGSALNPQLSCTDLFESLSNPRWAADVLADDYACPFAVASPYVHLPIHVADDIRQLSMFHRVREVEVERSAALVPAAPAQVPLAMCGVETATTLHCQHAYDVFGRVCMGGRPCDCAEMMCLGFCAGETVVTAEGTRLQWDKLVETFTDTFNRSCTAGAPLPSCAQEAAADAAAVQDLRDRVEQCFFASAQCFRADTSPDARRASIQVSLDAVGPHVLALVHRVLLNENLNQPCEYLVGAYRNVDGGLNARCAASGLPPHNSNDRLAWDGPLTSHADAGFVACLVHSDCAVGRFCALVNAPSASTAACMSCAHCCNAQADDVVVDVDHLWAAPMHGSEPGCGHCQCGECAPGCGWERLHNDECDEACFTAECGWDSLGCGDAMAAGEMRCPAASHMAGLSLLAPVIGARLAGCCVSDGAASTTAFTLAAHGDPSLALGQDHSDTGAVNPMRFVATRNRLLGGMLLHTTRHQPAPCGKLSEKYRELYPTCSAGPGTQPFGVNPVFEQVRCCRCR